MKIVELLIDWDNEEFGGVDIMSLVSQPAIGYTWQAFAEQHAFVDKIAGETEEEYVSRCIPVLIDEGYEQDQAAAICYASYDEFESVNDYPKAVTEAAKRGIRLNEENGNKCATQTGKVRAQQLAQGKPISMDTVKRMYSYLSRAETYYDPNDTTACGTISYLLWGGPTALSWAKRKVEQAEKLAQEDPEAYALELFSQYGENMDVEDVYMEVKEQFNDVTLTDIAKGIAALDILGKKDATKEGVIKYRYAGPSAQRTFCRAMLSMNKLYTKDELVEVGNRMRSQFPTIYPQRSTLDVNGDITGGVAQWMGGPNCSHFWEEVEVFRDGNGPRVVVSKGPASGDMGRPMNTRRNNGYQMSKNVDNLWHFSEDEQMVVTGPAMVADMLIPRRDENGDVFYVYFSADTVRKIAKKFLEENKLHNTDVNHDDSVTTENTLLESWIVEDPKMDKSTALGFDVPKNTWMISMKINNEETWNKVKSGELTGFSVAGTFVEKLS